MLSCRFDNLLNYFNSHAHVERDCTVVNVIFALNISTHTLTWSVTFKTLGAKRYAYISTHTLTWSVTNSFRWDYIPMIISTHTLTWSVTQNDS